MDIEFGDSPARPYILRVKVEKVSEVDGLVRPVPRAAVNFDGTMSLTNNNGYTFFTTSPGKHSVTVSSPQSLFPSFSTEIEVTTRVTELIVRYVERRYRPEAINVAVDVASQTSVVTFSYTPPFNQTIYVGQPYVTFINFDNYVKRFTGEVVVAYFANAPVIYSGPFTHVPANEQPSPLSTVATVSDLIQLVVIEESFVPTFTVEATLLRME